MDDSQERETLPLFEFLRLVAAAAGRKKLTSVRAAVATLTALDSQGTSGTAVVVRADQTALELGISERQVWRHFHALVADGWFEQTQKPTRGKGDSRGRRARYRLTSPSVNMTDVNCLTSPGGSMSNDPADSPESSDTSTLNRLTLSAQSSDIAERELGTVIPSDGIPSDGSPSLTNSPSAESAGHTREAGDAA